MATSVNTTMITRPIIALRSLRSRRSRRSSDDCSRTDVSVESTAVDAPETLPVAATPSSVLAIANPRVEEGVHDVDDQVRQHEDDRNQQDDALNDRVVTVKDGADQDAPDTANREDRLDDDGTAQEQ